MTKSNQVAPLLTGTLSIQPRGFGFIDLPSPSLLDSVYVPAKLIGNLMSGDEVSFTYREDNDGRAQATSLTLTRRSRTHIFGRVVKDRLEPDSHVALSPLNFAPRSRIKNGTAVLARITSKGLVPQEVFDNPHDPVALRTRILSRYQLPTTDDAKAVGEAQNMVKRAPKQIPGRRDLRSLRTYTIDSDSSMDLDDALSVLPADPLGAIRVFVHISDVAAAVKPNSPLDESARKVATSIYFPSWTRPMLPRILSEDQLSLLPEKDRNALTVELRLTPEGEITSIDVYESRIRSNRRLSYNVASAILDGDLEDGYPAELLEDLFWLRTAGARLGLQRTRRGGLPASHIEPEFKLVVEGNSVSTEKAEQSGSANLLIERLMVAANESVATWLINRGLPGLFRVHPTPDEDASRELEELATNLGYRPGFAPLLTPLALAAFAQQIDQNEDTRLVWDLMIRHLPPATYSPNPGTHFGLASNGYLHFTSPIRRYADLMVHRIIKIYLKGEREETAYPAHAELLSLTSHINIASRSASKAERDLRRALWLASLGEKIKSAPNKALPARVVSVNNRGAKVALEQEGLVGYISRSALSTSPSPGKRIFVKVSLLDPENNSLEFVEAKRPNKRRK